MTPTGPMLNKMRRAYTSRLLILVALSAAGIWSGCRWRPGHPPGTTAAETSSTKHDPPEPTVDPSQHVQPEQASKPPQDATAEPTADRHQDNQREPTVIWNDLLKQTKEYLERDALDEARRNLTKLEGFQLDLSAEQTEQLAAARLELEGRLTGRQLRTAVQMLASSEREEVQTAQDRLFEHSGAALPLLRESVRDGNPLLVRNTLEMLRMLRQPELTLPIMVEVLQRPEQLQSWPDAIREIELAAAPGAGEPLLRLALSSDLPEQRTAALSALAKVVDPPRRTVMALLPLISESGPELAAALTAANHALAVHHQHGLLSGRGLEEQLSAEQLEQLGALPARLSQIMAVDADPPGEAARAARMLAISLRQVPAEPLAGIKILALSDEKEDSRAAAVLDRQWNTVDTKMMWRHSADRQGSILLDLGGARTVAGVRIWNLNEPGGAHRGWKDVAVYVGRAPSDLSQPVSTGVVPQAPGKADGPDYSTTVPVNFVPGRYVRLQAESVWRKDSHAGLTEVQVLGF